MGGAERLAKADTQDEDTSGGGDTGLDRTEDLGEPGPGGDGGVVGVAGAGAEAEVVLVGQSLEEVGVEQAGEARVLAEGEAAGEQGEGGPLGGGGVRRHGAPRRC